MVDSLSPVSVVAAPFSGEGPLLDVLVGKRRVGGRQIIDLGTAARTCTG